MKTTDLTAIADKHTDCAIGAVRARFGGTREPSMEVISAYMRSMALAELAEEVRSLAGKVENLTRAVEQIGGDIGSAAELIANAVVK